MASGEMTTAELTDFLLTAFRNMADVSFDGAIQFLCMDWRHMEEMLAAGREVYSELKNLIVWAKDNGGTPFPWLCANNRKKLRPTSQRGAVINAARQP